MVDSHKRKKVVVVSLSSTNPLNNNYNGAFEMAFTLPAAIELHRNDADENVGTILGDNLDLGLKNGGNLPISSEHRASEMSNQTTSAADGPVAGVLFGLAGRQSLANIDASTNRLLIGAFWIPKAFHDMTSN